MSTLSVPLPQKEKERLSRLAMQYGLSLAEFSRHILTQIASDIPEESFDDYENPEELRASYRRAVRDWRAGRTRTKL